MTLCNAISYFKHAIRCLAMSFNCNDLYNLILYNLDNATFILCAIYKIEICRSIGSRVRQRTKTILLI